MPTNRFDRLPADAGLWMQAWADKFLGDLEDALGDITTNIANITAAQNTATAAAREAARLASYTNPTNVLTAADVGSDATITIAAHTRVYPVQGSIDVPDVAVAGGAITGRAFSTQYSIYYDDTSLASTTPAYLAVLTASAHATAQPGAAAGRHFVGVITTPADGGAGTGGSGGFPPGGGGGTVLP